MFQRFRGQTVIVNSCGCRMMHFVVLFGSVWLMSRSDDFCETETVFLIADTFFGRNHYVVCLSTKVWACRRPLSMTQAVRFSGRNDSSSPNSGDSCSQIGGKRTYIHRRRILSPLHHCHKPNKATKTQRHTLIRNRFASGLALV